MKLEQIDHNTGKNDQNDDFNQLKPVGTVNPPVDYAQGQADRRAENAQLCMVGRTMASDKQIGYIQILLREGHLDRDDFTTSREFFRKKTRTAYRADQLIRLGKQRKAEWKNRPAY